MKENESLKPCPFCGGEVSIKLSGDSEYGFFWLVTRGNSLTKHNCNCRVYMEGDLMEVAEGEKFNCNSRRAKKEYNELIEAWNRRCEDGTA